MLRPIFFCLLTVAMQAQSGAQAESEKAIRKLVHDFTASSMKGDGKAVVGMSSRHMLGFYDVFFGAMLEATGDQDRMAKAGVKTGSDFLAQSIRAVAAGFKGDTEGPAKQNASGAAITFQSDAEATVVLPPPGKTVRAVKEGKDWKIDNTEEAKKGVLASAMMQRFSAEQRKKLEDY